MSTRTEKLKGDLKKARALRPKNKEDQLVETLILTLELAIELHERIDGLEERSRSFDQIRRSRKYEI